MSEFINIVLFFVIILLIGYIFYLKLNIKAPIPKISNIFHTNNHIPKRIIQVWKTWTNKTPEMFKEYTLSLKNMNPDFEYVFFKE